MIEVSRLKDLNAAHLFHGFRIGPSIRHDFAVFERRSTQSPEVKGYVGNKMSVGAQKVVVPKAFVEGGWPGLSA